jgi:peptidoglycan/LPS O-acetylase OafA/YrhL
MAGSPETAPVNPQPADAHRFVVLDGMRGIAAFAVILDHVSSLTLRSWLPGRYLAVDFFFVLSGFVLAHAYGQRLETNMSPWAFMRVRLIRLYPLFLLGIALGLVLPVIGAFRGWEDAPLLNEAALIALFGLFFLPAPPVYGWTGGHLYPFDSPAWSLFFELVANAVYGFIARFLTWRVFAIGLPIAAALVALTVLRHDEVEGPGWLWPHFDAGLARVIYCFFAGVLVYRVCGAIKVPAIPAWAAALVLLAIFAIPAAGLWRQGYDAFAAIVLFPLLVAFASGAKASGAIAKLCATLGLLSYGVYVLHVPLRGLVAYGLDMVNVELPYGFLEVVLVAGTAALAAWIAHHAYDMPVRRWLSGRAKAKRSQLPAGEAG